MKKYSHWGDGQTKIDGPTDIICQWCTIPPQKRHSAVRGIYKESVAAGSVAFKLDNKQQGATMIGKTNRLVTQEVRE